MVHKNRIYGEIHNVTHIELGDGDVIVSDTKSEGYNGISFINDSPKTVNTSHNLSGKNTNETGLDALITFKNIESLEVFERSIQRIKKIMIKNKN